MTQDPNRAEFLIVGAGPAGLSLAIALAQAGAEPLLIEKRAEPATTSRAAVVHSRTLEMLGDLHVTQRLLEEGIQVPVFRVRDRDRVLMEVDFSGLETEYPFTLMCPQERTEAILTDRLEALGGSILRDTELLSAKFGEADSKLVIQQAGAQREIAAGWVIGCDGAHSVVREQAGIGFEGGAYDEAFVLADVRMDWPLSREEVSLFFSPAGLVVVAPLPGDRFRIVATVDDAPDRPDAALMGRLVAERGPTGGKLMIHEIVWSSRFRVSHKIADRFAAGRVILCGDAAHVHSPAGGQGMNTGIQDAISLAGPLIEAARTGGGSALSHWEESRRKIARDVVTNTDRMTRGATIQSPVGRAVRNAALTVAGHIPGIPPMIARKLAELDRR